MIKFKQLHFLLLFILLSFAACSGDDEDGEKELPAEEWVEVKEEIAPNIMTYYTSLDVQEEKSPQKVLGYGYDVTGKVSSIEAVRGQVFNVNWSDADEPNTVSYIVGRAAYGFVVSGLNRKDYLKNLNMGRFGRVNDSENLNYHAGTLLDVDQINDKGQKYLYWSEHYAYEYAKYGFLILPYILKLYQTDSFKADVEQLSSGELIKKYGTHLIYEVKTGCRLDMLYCAKTSPKRYVEKNSGDTKIEELSDEEKIKIVGAGAGDAASKIGLSFMHWENNPENEERVKRNTNPIVYIQAFGGNKNVLECGLYNLEKGYPEMDQKKWLKVKDGENEIDTYSVIFIDDAVPLYKLIENKEKQAELKKAIDDYILSSQIK